MACHFTAGPRITSARPLLVIWPILLAGSLCTPCSPSAAAWRRHLKVPDGAGSVRGGASHPHVLGRECRACCSRCSFLKLEERIAVSGALGGDAQPPYRIVPSQGGCRPHLYTPGAQAWACDSPSPRALPPSRRWSGQLQRVLAGALPQDAADVPGLPFPKSGVRQLLLRLHLLLHGIHQRWRPHVPHE